MYYHNLFSDVKKPPSPQQPPAPTSPPKGPTIKEPQSVSNTPQLQNINYDRYYVPRTPYPDKGIIMQSLNYIQMDVFSSLFKAPETEKEPAPETSTNHKREPAILSQALYNIENNFRSLF